MVIYTDGACKGNPGEGSWAFIHKTKPKDIKRAKYYEDTANNRMELEAIVEALWYAIRLIKKRHKKVKKVSIYSDSAYVCNSINQKWLEMWVQNDWLKKSNNKPVAHSDLWKSLIQARKVLKGLGYKCEFHKVEAHAGVVYNEKVDRLANRKIFKCTANPKIKAKLRKEFSFK